MESRGRCPRCGYVTRGTMLEYVCDYCGLRQWKSLSSMVGSLENNLRGKVDNFIQTYTYQPRNPQSTLQRCGFCGFNIYPGVQKCPRCGKPASNLTPFEERVFEYISSHGGTISRSQAARELGVPLESLDQTIERLKAMGLLGET